MSLKVGIVGLVRGKAYVGCFRKAGIEVMALCDSNEQVLEEAGAEFGISDLYTEYEQFLSSDTDIVVIATPLPLHTEQCIAAMDNGKHVLSEVPPVNSIEEGRALFQAVKKSKTKYMLAQNSCYSDRIRSWKQMITDGRIGEIMYAEAEYIQDCRAFLADEIKAGKTWRSNMPPIHYCTHSLGPLLYVMNDRCISAQGLQTTGHFTKTGTAADMEVGIFKTEKGAVIKILIGFWAFRKPASAERPWFHYYSIYGNKGCLETTRDVADDKTLAYVEDIPNLKGMISLPLPGIPPMSADGTVGGTEYLIVNDFVEAILKDKPTPVGVEEALNSGLPGICAHQSAMNDGGVVKIPVF